MIFSLVNMERGSEALLESCAERKKRERRKKDEGRKKQENSKKEARKKKERGRRRKQEERKKEGEEKERRKRVSYLKNCPEETLTLLNIAFGPKSQLKVYFLLV